MFLLRLKCAILVGIVSLAVAGPVEAQIYIWRDANGNPALGDAPPRGTSNYRTFQVPGASKAILATRAPAGDYTGQYDSLIERYSASNGVRADLVRAVIQVESGFNPRARSPKGARGLMQLMPATALDLGVANSYDPEDNIRGGVRYLRMLLDRFSNDETLALAAYNAGPLTVEKYGFAVPPYRETQDYVERVQIYSPLGTAAAAAKLQASKTSQSPPAPPKPIPPQGSRTLYKTVVINSDGQPIAKYSDSKPASGEFETVTLRR